MRVRKFGGGAQLARIEPKELKARNQLGLTESSMFGEHLSVHKRMCSTRPQARAGRLRSAPREDAAAVLEPLLEAIGPIENFDQVEVFLFGL